VTEFIPSARPIIGADELAAADRVLRSGMLAQGAEVAAFEIEFAEGFRLGRTCVAVNSGTSGLHLGLLAAGVGPGDEVIVPSFTFAATANAVALTGACPVFADIEPRSFCLDPSAVEAAITPRTVGVMPVHLYGHPADMTALGGIADRHDLALFEDAAQAHGAAWREQPVGTFGRFAMFSFYPTKNMTAGEGGMVTVSDTSMARLLRLYRNQGMLRQYENEIVGFNCRMTDLHAAIDRAQLTKVAGWTAQRRANADFYRAQLSGVVVPPIAPGAVQVFHQFTVRVPDDRDGLAKALLAEFKVGTGLFYPIPAHRLPAFVHTSASTADLPETERAAAEVLSIPVHPTLSTDDRHRVANAVNVLTAAGAS
jgi:dTDP-4-amino-4,6-dideoxygalactose transaminase